MTANTAFAPQEVSRMSSSSIRICSLPRILNIGRKLSQSFGICKIFVLCKLIGGHFKKNIETTEFSFFLSLSFPSLPRKIIMPNGSICDSTLIPMKNARTIRLNQHSIPLRIGCFFKYVYAIIYCSKIQNVI